MNFGHLESGSSSEIGPVPNIDGIVAEPGQAFVSTAQIQEFTERALVYLRVGFAVHLTGPAGTGKTTLAFHLAAQLGRTVTLIHGDDEFGSSDLLGKDTGYRKYRLVDNFIHSVLKTEEELQSFWVDNRLTTACRRGDTLIYDEFNRSRPEANNALLSILSERILNLPRVRQARESYLQVHPEFHAIFTSNSEEYAGVHKTQDALLDRLVTLYLEPYDRETEVLITIAKSGIPRGDAEIVVDIVRDLRKLQHGNSPSVRTCVAVAQVLVHLGGSARWDDPIFQRIQGDLFTQKSLRSDQPVDAQDVAKVVRKISSRMIGMDFDEKGGPGWLFRKDD